MDIKAAIKQLEEANAAATCEAQREQIERRLQASSAEAETLIRDPAHRAASVVKSSLLCAQMISQTATAGVAAMAIAACNIPGELRVEAFEVADERTFTVYKGEHRIGTLILEVCSQQSGHVGGAVRTVLNQDILTYGVKQTGKDGEEVPAKPSAVN